MAGPASASPRPQVWRFPTGRPEPKTSSLHRVQQGGAFRKAFGHKNSKADGLVFYTASQISQHIEVDGPVPISPPMMDEQSGATCRITPFHYSHQFPICCYLIERTALKQDG